MDNFQIETAQNVSIQQNVANVSTRIGSFLIDMLLIIAFYLVIIFIFSALGIDKLANLSVMWVLMGLPVFFYSLLFETFMNGQTPGKYVNKIRVVKLDGSKPSFANYLFRWVLRIIDISLASGSVALLTILLNGKGQRLGDLAAGTTVISERKRIGIQNTINVDIPDEYVPRFPQVTVLSDRDVQTIKELFYKAKKQKNHKVISKLHNKIIDLTGITTDLVPIDFVEIIINDYNYYTQNM
jgi:uncharacterized RDD family membrane protein YckC